MNELFKNLTNKDERVHVKPFIPKEKARNAIATYTDKIKIDDIILLIDDTMMGSGKSGVVVTENTIYMKEDFENPISYDYEYIPSLSGKKTLMGVDIYVGRNKAINIAMPQKNITLDILETINEYINKIRNKNRNISEQEQEQEQEQDSNTSKIFSFAKKIGSIANSAISEKSFEINEVKRKLGELSDDELIRIVNSDSFFSRSTQEKSIAFSILKSRGYNAEEIKK